MLGSFFEIKAHNYHRTEWLHLSRRNKSMPSQRNFSIKLLMEALFKVFPNWKEPICPSIGKHLKNCSTFFAPWILGCKKNYKRNRKQLMHIITRISRQLQWMKKSQSQEVICILFHLYKILEMRLRFKRGTHWLVFKPGTTGTEAGLQEGHFGDHVVRAIVCILAVAITLHRDYSNLCPLLFVKGAPHNVLCHTCGLFTQLENWWWHCFHLCFKQN